MRRCARPACPPDSSGSASASRTPRTSSPTSRRRSVMSEVVVPDRYRLFYMPGTASFAVHWMLLEIGAPFELSKVDFAVKAQHAPDYLVLNPDGVVPTLVIDGVPRGETAALLLLLPERHPQKQLAPPLFDPSRPEFVQ